MNFEIKEKEFNNGYKALLAETSETELAVRLYSPSGKMVASTKCNNAATFPYLAEGLMYGYFAGWTWCQKMLAKSVEEALSVEFP